MVGSGIAMHEIAIMQSALELAEEQARKAGGTAISRIRLRVGLLSGVVPESIEFAFSVLKQDTLASGAELEIERVPGRFQCTRCGALHELGEMKFDCPECGGLLAVTAGGADLELAQLEIT